jgi:hypothetical protein
MCNKKAEDKLRRAKSTILSCSLALYILNSKIGKSLRFSVNTKILYYCITDSCHVIVLIAERILIHLKSFGLNGNEIKWTTSFFVRESGNE